MARRGRRLPWVPSFFFFCEVKATPRIMDALAAVRIVSRGVPSDVKPIRDDANEHVVRLDRWGAVVPVAILMITVLALVHVGSVRNMSRTPSADVMLALMAPATYFLLLLAGLVGSP